MTDKEIRELWDNLIEEGRVGYSRFSCYDEIRKDRVSVMMKDFYKIDKGIDLKSTKPLLVGPILVTIHDDDYASEIIESPTIKDIANYFHTRNDGHHIFLEKIKIYNDIKEINLFSGS